MKNKLNFTIGLIINFIVIIVLPSVNFAQTPIPSNNIRFGITVQSTSFIHVDASNTIAPWDGSKTNPYRTIADGLQAAVSGNTIVVAAGTYSISGDLNVPAGVILFFEPGVVNRFAAGKRLLVSGTLSARGAISDSIRFTSQNAGSTWGGIRFVNADSVSVMSFCVIENGLAGGATPGNKGGGIYCSGSSPTIQNCTIRKNIADYGGGIYCDGLSAIKILDNSVINNIAKIGGGGMCCDNASPKVRNNLFSGNITQGTGDGGGMAIHNSSFTLENNEFTNNRAQDKGGAVFCNNSQIQFYANQFGANRAASGGGLYFFNSELIILEENTIYENVASNNGGGIFAENTTGLQLTRNQIYADSAANGAGVYLSGGQSANNQNLFVANVASGYGGGLYANNTNANVTNSILWSNSAMRGSQIFENGGITVTYCDVQGGWPGNGNINMDPMFADLNSYNFHLRPGSPCINTGNPSDPTDPNGSVVDMGVYYYTNDMPLLAFSPDSLSFHLNEGENQSAQITLQNKGAAAFNYKIDTGQSLLFDGERDFAVVAGSTKIDSLIGAQQFSIELWVKTTASNCYLLDKTDRYNENQGITLLIDHAGKLIFFIEDRDDNHSALISTSAINDGNWHHIAVTLDRKHHLGQKIYIDSKLEARCDPTQVYGVISNDVPLQLGAASLTRKWSLNGQIDDLRIWERIRSARDIAVTAFYQLYGSEDHLAAYFPFDGDHGKQAQSRGGSALTMSLYNDARLTPEDAYCTTWVSLSPDSGSINVGNQQNVQVTFAGSGTFYGYPFEEITTRLLLGIQDVNEKTPDNFIEVQGTLQRQPAKIVVNRLFQFGESNVDVHKYITMTIQNSGNTALHINRIENTNSDFQFDLNPFYVNGQSSVTKTITFTPSKTGMIRGLIVMNTSDPNEPSMQIVLEGQGVAHPTLAVNPESFDITLSQADSTTRTMSISNTGASNLHWSIATTDLNHANQIISANEIRQILAENERISRDKQPHKSINEIQHIRPKNQKNLSILKNDLMENTNAGVIKAVVLDGGAYHFGGIYSQAWDQLNIQWQNFGSIQVIIDYASFGGKTITYEDLQMSGADVLIISNNFDAASPYEEFTQQECEAISKYVEEGHGLYVSGGTFNDNGPGAVPNHSAYLAPLFELDVSVKFNWGQSFTSQPVYAIHEGHLLFNRMGSPYQTNWVKSNRPVSVSDWSMAIDADFIVASDQQKSTVILANDNRIYHSSVPELQSNQQDLQFLYNTLLYCSQQKSNWLSLSASSGLTRPGQQTQIEASFSGESLNDGEYFSQMFISSNDPANTMLEIPVELTITESNIHVTLTYDPQQFSVKQSVQDYQQVETKIAEMHYGGQIGYPELPEQLVKIVAPANARFESVGYRAEQEVFAEKVKLIPVQPGRAISDKNEPKQFVEGKAEIYNQQELYPENAVRYLETEYFGPYKIFVFEVQPIAYAPAQQKLLLNKNISIFVNTTASDFRTEQRWNEPVFSDIVKNQVHNKEDMFAYYPNSQLWNQSSSRVKYLIVTSEELKDEFQALADWKTQKGVPAKVLTTHEIYSNYAGATDQVKIKNCIYDYYKNKGTMWVLLGGDDSVVPDQNTSMLINLWFGNWYDDKTIPADLFYACFDKQFDWNLNGNDRVAEPQDNADLYPELFVGRASVRAAEHAQAYVEKTIRYEKNIPAKDFGDQLLLVGMKLWENWDGHSDADYWNETVYSDYIQPYWSGTKKRFYDTDTDFGGPSYDINVDHFAEQVNRGYNFSYIIAHGNQGLFGMEDGKGVYVEDAYKLRNTNKQGIFYAVGCNVNAFDQELNTQETCLSEAFLRNPNGGAVAFIGNARLGWGKATQELHSSLLVGALFQKALYSAEDGYDNHKLGVLFAMNKASFASTEDDYLRHEQFSLNLLGDPELDVYTANPGMMDIQLPATITVGPQEIDIQTGVPNALVCLQKGNEIYQYGYADPTGSFMAQISPETTGQMTVTATAHNYVAFEGKINVISSNSPVVLLHSLTCNDTPVTDEFAVRPGQNLAIKPTLKNAGQASASGVSAKLSTSNIFVNFTTDSLNFGDLAAGATTSGNQIFQCSVLPDLPPGTECCFQLTIYANENNRWTETFTIHTSAPDISISTDSLLFADTFVGYRDTVNFIAANEGTESLTIQNIGINTTHFSVLKPSQAPVTINAGDSLEIALIFKPQTAGAQSTSLTIQSNDPDEANLQIPVQAEGLGLPLLAFQPGNLQATVASGSSAIKNVTFLNNGSSALQWRVSTEETSPYVSCTPASGVISEGRNQAVQIKLDAGSLLQGNYAPIIRIATNNPSQPISSLPTTLTVSEGNICPVIAAIPEQWIRTGQSFSQIELDQYVNDLDHNDNQISWTALSNPNLNVNISNRVATVTAKNSGWQGTETVTFVGTDAKGASDSCLTDFTIGDGTNINISGDISGTWDKALYVITSTVRVPRNQTLDIRPGTKIYAFNDASFRVEGTLNAAGEETQPIRFGHENSSWKGIEFNMSSFGTLRNCMIQNSKTTGVNAYFADVTMEGCEIEDCKTGMKISGRPIYIKNSKIHDNSEFGIEGGALSSEIVSCEIYNNGGRGVSITSGVLEHCLIYGNQTGIDASYSTGAILPNIQNCTIVDNEYGVKLGQSITGARIKNCIIYFNQTNLSLHDEATSFNLSYSNIGEQNFEGEGNISSDPKFIDVDKNNYQLHASSPCVNAGDPSSSKDSDGSRNDMGYTGGLYELSGTELAGEISGTLSAPVYLVTGEIKVPMNQTLTITPGVIIYFNRNVELSVEGKLTANGTLSRPIQFLSGESSCWQGIRFWNGDGCRLSHCIIRDSQENGLFVNDGSPTFEYCEISDCYTGIKSSSNDRVFILNSQIHDNSTWGLDFGANLAIIEKCEIFENKQGGLNVRNAIIGHTLVHGNDYGIHASLPNSPVYVVLKNCTITKNSAAGLNLGEQITGVSIRNCIFFQNEEDIAVPTEATPFTIQYTNVGDELFSGEGNLNCDPQFTDPNAGNFSLKSSSPCRNAGDPASNPDADGSRNDMGWTGGLFQPTGVEVSGDISGNWNQPVYIAVNDITVPYGQTLTIQAGTRIYFNNFASLKIYGNVQTNSSSGEKIIFQTGNIANWGGIILSGSGANASRISHAIIEDCWDYGINFSNTNLTIDHCEIRACFNGIRMNNSDVVLRHCQIHDNRNDGIKDWNANNNDKNLTLHDCEIYNNSGSSIYFNGNISGQNCLIYKNDAGIRTANQTGKMRIHNFTIADNVSYGITSNFSMNASDTLSNTIIYRNGADLSIPSDPANMTIRYSDIGGSVKPGIGNMMSDPMFKNTLSNDYHLRGSSPCIDRGDPLSRFANEPTPNGGRINLGFYGNTSEATVKGKQPLLAGFPTVRFNEDESQVISRADLSQYISSEISDSLVHWFLGKADHVRLSGMNEFIKFTADSNWYGQENITIVASVDGLLNDSLDVTARVSPVNDPPVLRGIPDVYMKTNASKTIDLLPFVSDVDSPDSAFSWTASSNSEGLRIEILENEMTIEATEAPPVSEVYITVSDESGAKDSDTLKVHVGTATGLALDESANIPKKFALHQNYPNPFNAETTIKYDIPEKAGANIQVVVKIYSILGTEVRTLVNRKNSPGRHAVIWDGKDKYGVTISSGLYLCAISAGEFRQCNKLLIIK